MIDSILTGEGRRSRPPKMVIILRGVPGSGKSHLAKLIKNREMEAGGEKVRTMCLDDYFDVDGVYEYEPPEFKPSTHDEPGTIGPSKRLRGAPNAFLQPHSGSATTRARQEMQYLCMRNIKAVLLEGRGPLTPVNVPLNPRL